MLGESASCIPYRSIGNALASSISRLWWSSVVKIVRLMIADRNQATINSERVTGSKSRIDVVEKSHRDVEAFHGIDDKDRWPLAEVPRGETKKNTTERPGNETVIISWREGTGKPGAGGIIDELSLLLLGQKITYLSICASCPVLVPLPFRLTRLSKLKKKKKRNYL